MLHIPKKNYLCYLKFNKTCNFRLESSLMKKDGKIAQKLWDFKIDYINGDQFSKEINPLPNHLVVLVKRLQQKVYLSLSSVLHCFCVILLCHD